MRFLEMSPPNLTEVREALGCVAGDADRAKDIVGRIRSKTEERLREKSVLTSMKQANEVNGDGAKRNRQGCDIGRFTLLMDGLVPVKGDRVQLQQVASCI